MSAALGPTHSFPFFSSASPANAHRVCRKNAKKSLVVPIVNKINLFSANHTVVCRIQELWLA